MDIIEKPIDPIKKAEKKEKKKKLKVLGSERTRISFERLQLAWLRTAITFIALGFTSYRFYLSRTEEGKTHLMDHISGREIGIFLVAVGFMGLLQATIQHRKNYARQKALNPNMFYSVSLVQSYFILVFTFFMLLAMFFKL